MPQVQTVRGPVDATALGRTLAHEHIFVLTADVQQNSPEEWGDEQARVSDAVERLQALKAKGIDTIFDPTVIGLGRYVPRIVRIAEQVDLNIVVATGVYTYDSVPKYWAHRGPAVDPSMPDPMVDLFVRDLTDAIPGTSVKAGFLKCAIDHDGMTAGVERVLRAVARASVTTGAPVMVHTHPGSKTGLEVARVLEEGVDPRRVQLAHSGDTTDADHLAELADRGFVLGMDRFGIELEMPADDRAGIVAEMCSRGYAGSMVLSQDASCYIDWVDPQLLPMLPNWHYTYLSDTVIPDLQQRGVTDEQVEQMLVETPRRWIAGE